MADRSTSPVIPTYIHNSWRILPPASALMRPHKLYVCLGKPMRVPELSEGETRAQVHAEFAANVMKSIERLRAELLASIGIGEAVDQREDA